MSDIESFNYQASSETEKLNHSIKNTDDQKPSSPVSFAGLDETDYLLSLLPAEKVKVEEDSANTPVSMEEIDSLLCMLPLTDYTVDIVEANYITVDIKPLIETGILLCNLSSFNQFYTVPNFTNKT